MHIKTPQSALLSNHEVLLHIRTVEAEYTGQDGTDRERLKPPGLKNMLQDTLIYLQSADQNAALTSLSTTHPERPMTLYKGPHSLFRKLSPKYQLNKAEYLQIYNLKPTSLIVLCLIVEEWDTRFTEDQMNDMIAIITEVFDEEEAAIPEGVEYQAMEKIDNKLIGAKKKRKNVKRRGA